MTTNLIVDYGTSDYVRNNVGNRAIAQLSDGSWIAVLRDNSVNFRVYTSPNRTTWTYSGIQVVAGGLDSISSYAVAVDAADNIHMVRVDNLNRTRYNKLTFSAGPTWSVGASETGVDTPASGTLSYPAIEVLDSGVIVVACLHITGTNNSKLRMRARHTGGTWGTEFTATLTVPANDGLAIGCNIARDAASAAGGSQKFMACASGATTGSWLMAGYSVV